MKENLSEHELYILEAAALTHDIGIKKAEEIYGRCDGSLQEQLGPDIAREMLKAFGFDENDIARICYLIANHHTYTDIDGTDYRILVEADFLVNLYEDDAEENAVILDLGCGTGLELEFYFRLNPTAKVTGIDLAPGMLAAFKEKFSDKDITLIQGSYFNVPFNENTYDKSGKFSRKAV